MRYLSLFSGIEAASVAWEPLGWEPVAFAEIDLYACSVLQHHYPDVRNLGDVEGWHDWPVMRFDVLIGGSPCQSFSFAGSRAGLDDPRGNLALVFMRVVDRYRPRWVVWENVPGALAIDGGRAFGSILRALGECGYGFAWRVLDTRYTRVSGYCAGVPQRRRRLFLVGRAGDWRGAAAVLFDAPGRGWHPPPVSGAAEEQQESADRSGSGASAACSGGPGIPRAANILTARMGKGINTTMDEGQTLLVVDARQDPTWSRGVAQPLDTRGHSQAVVGDPVVLNIRQNAVHARGTALPLSTYGDNHALFHGSAIRRLTPRECERLQGFPDDYTLVRDPRGRLMSDTQRYRLLGNSMSVNVIRWLGMRIAMVDQIKGERP